MLISGGLIKFRKNKKSEKLKEQNMKINKGKKRKLIKEKEEN